MFPFWKSKQSNHQPPVRSKIEPKQVLSTPSSKQVLPTPSSKPIDAYLLKKDIIIFQASDEIEIDAVGRLGELGELYDARNDTFCKTTIVKPNSVLPKSAIQIQDKKSTRAKYIYSNTLSERFSLLDISSQMQLSILAGQVGIEGTAKHLFEKSSNVNTVMGTLIYKIETKIERLNLNNIFDGSENVLYLDALRLANATHVIVEIEWGATVLISYSKTYENNSKKEEIQKMLQGKFADMHNIILAKTGAKVKNRNDCSKINEFNVEATADGIHLEQPFITNEQEAKELIKNIPILIKESNDSKGRPLKFKMIPIGLLQKKLGLKLNEKNNFRSIPEESITKMSKVFDEIALLKHDINEKCVLMKSREDCLSHEQLNSFSEIKNEVEKAERNLRKDLKGILFDIRSKQAEPVKLKELSKTSKEIAKNIRTKLQTLKPIEDKIKIIDSAKDKAIDFTYIGQGKNLNSELAKCQNKHIHVLKYSTHVKNMVTIYNSLMPRLFKDKYKFFLVDCDIHKSITNAGELEKLKRKKFFSRSGVNYKVKAVIKENGKKK